MPDRAKYTPGPWFCGSHSIETSAGTKIVQTTTAMSVANAHLIAAAPDLLAALQVLVKIIDPDIDQDYSPSAKPLATAILAIAKATGGKDNA